MPDPRSPPRARSRSSKDAGERVSGGDLGLVLVCDDDADVARFIELNLRLEGFDVVVAHDGLEALGSMERHQPDIALLDVMMPRVDGVGLLERLRADPGTASMPVIMLTAKDTSADRVVALVAGADDYIAKPFDTMELVARVRSVLRRNREIRGVSPLTGLPGNERILAEIRTRFGSGRPCAVCYVDVANFKSFNDVYGFLRGDTVLTLLAQSLLRAVAEAGAPTPFLGHIGGDDFVVTCAPEQAEPIGDRAIELFDAGRTTLYDPADAARGYLEVTDRRGEPYRHPLVSLSVGVALSSRRSFGDFREMVEVATEMKNVAKALPGSAVAVDRRIDA